MTARAFYVPIRAWEDPRPIPVTLVETFADGSARLDFHDGDVPQWVRGEKWHESRTVARARAQCVAARYHADISRRVAECLEMLERGQLFS